MGDPITTTAIVATTVAVGGKIAGGISAQKSAKTEANLLRDQGILAQQEAYATAQQKADEVRRFAKTQKLAFLKNGVTLQGTPSMVISETVNQGQDEVNAIVKKGIAENRLAIKQAELVRNKGRAAMFSGITNAFGDVASFGLSGAQAGIF